MALVQDQQQVETHQLDIGDYTGDVVDGLPHGKGALEFRVPTNSCCNSSPIQKLKKKF